ncbi:NAD(P)/FAD-dependent oxidoreductase [Streptomyces sp. NBC_00859]|uniref:NAD(P)/FAD-dependent oxidoreductase n=1 Tax=Streptomyces sp. NBC_00859 TaxID=2903682 RepID=UPI00386E4F07|nr:FAD-dependent monooxygenase [Streptomyces sp. NBC_00859]
MSSYDVIVVGARCAGAGTAMLLARQGRRVLLLDRAAFPEDTLSTLYIQLPGVAVLADWGLLDRLRATGCPPLERVSYRAAGITVTGSSRPVSDQRINYAPRRHLLDQLLVEAAVAAGAEFRDATNVGELLFTGGRVTGVRCRTAGGGWVSEHAGLVVGADGMRSRVARQVRAGVLTSAAPKSCAYYAFWDVPSDNVMSMTRADGVLVGSAATNDATIVACYLRQREFARARQRPLEVYLETIREHNGELYERLRSAGPTERLYGTGDQQNFIRQAAGPGWALVGDAAVHKDSITAWGITDAFLQAQLLADTLASVPAQDRALAEYAATLRSVAQSGYRAALAAADLNDFDEAGLAYLRRLADHPDLADLYFSMASGAVTPQDFQTAYQAHVLTAPTG